MNAGEQSCGKSASGITVVSNPTTGDIDRVKSGLKAFNDLVVGDDCHRPLSFVIKDKDDETAGGVIGGTYWGWLHIEFFWIKEEYRNRGLGSLLLGEMEREALKRGCRYAHLDTHDFQALGYYLKHGYEIKAELSDLPPGHVKYLLWKRLA